MVCYQVSARYTFRGYKPFLVSAGIKKQKAAAFLARSGLPFGHRLKASRFFRTEREAARYVSYLYAVYKNHVIPDRAAMDGRCDQAHEFLQRKNSKLKISMDADFSAGQQSVV
jgi:hypothetical protein